LLECHSINAVANICKIFGIKNFLAFFLNKNVKKNKNKKQAQFQL